jgi:hypothetical protein
MTDAEKQGIEREIIQYWERQRITYNGVLLVVGVAMVILTGIVQLWPFPLILFSALIYGTVANICYCIGPYLNLLGVPQFRTREAVWKPLFYLGLLGSIFLTILLAAASALVPF